MGAKGNVESCTGITPMQEIWNHLNHETDVPDPDMQMSVVALKMFGVLDDLEREVPGVTEWLHTKLGELKARTPMTGMGH